MSTSSNNPLDYYPAATPPTDVTSNFIDPPTEGPEIQILGGVFTGFMIIAVLVRLLVRARITKQWGWDDLTCSLAAIGSLAHLIIYTQYFLALVATCGIFQSQKYSSQGTPNIDKTFKRNVHVGVVILALFYIAMIGVAVASLNLCNGIAASTLQFCENYDGPVVMLNAVFNVISDIWILILPFPLLRKLQLRFRQKLGLTIVFAAGLAACATSLARMVQFAINYKNTDVLWVQAINAEFTIVEMNVGIIVACTSTFPICFANLKIYIQSATNSLRTLLPSSSAKGHSLRTSDLPKDSFLQTHESMDAKDRATINRDQYGLREVNYAGDWA